MGAALLSLIGPLLGPILAAIAALVAFAAFYFGIKRKGVVQERERQEAKRVEEVAKTQSEVQKATLKDSEVDKKVANEIKVVVEKVGEPMPSSSLDKFRF